MRLIKTGNGKREATSGSALLLSLLAVVVVATLASSFMQLSSAVTKRQARAVDTKQAFYMAEAGLAEAYAGLKIGKRGKIGSPTQPAVLGNGAFWVETEQLSADMIRLDSTGLVGSGRAQLSMVLEKGELSAAALGIFSENGLLIETGTRIDGYDSEREKYAPRSVSLGSEELEPPKGLIGSNGTIAVNSVLGNEAILDANVIPGPNTTLVQNGTPILTGVAEPRLNNVTLPPVYIPQVSMGQGIQHNSGSVMQINPGVWGYPYLNVGAESDLVVLGPATLVVNDLQLADQSKLVLDTTGGPVDIVVTGSLNANTGSIVETSGIDPSQAKLRFAGTSTVQLQGTAAFYGTVFAPDAQVNVGSQFEIFGSLVGENLALASGAKVHFDTYLGRLAEIAAMPEHLTWRILDLAPLPGSSVDSDPFVILGIDPATLMPPASSHEDVTLDIMYYDRADVFQTYSGMESGFDWTNVKMVVSGTRDGDDTTYLEGKTALRVP